VTGVSSDEAPAASPGTATAHDHAEPQAGLIPADTTAVPAAERVIVAVLALLRAVTLVLGGLELPRAVRPHDLLGASLLLAMSMATRLFGLTAEEALLGVTRHAARALGLHGERGALAPGQVADFVVWNLRSIEELGYWIGFNPRRTVVRAAEVLRWPNPTL